MNKVTGFALFSKAVPRKDCTPQVGNIHKRFRWLETGAGPTYAEHRALTVEFPLEVLSEAGFPLALLRTARFLRFLRQDLYGFQISCKLQTAQVPAFEKKWKQYEAVVTVKRLHPTSKDGLETLFIWGRWLKKASKNSRDQAAKTLRSLSKCQSYLSRPPEVVGEKLRIAIEGEQSKITRLLARLDNQKVSYSIAKLAEHPKADFILYLAT